jgi:hypothetical protein
MDCENPDEAIYASVGEALAEARIRKPCDKAEKLENAAPEAENAEEPAFGKRQSAESDGSPAEPNAEIGENSDESPFSCGGAGQEAAERLLKAFYSVELDSRNKKGSCEIISCALDQALPEIGKEDEEKRKIELKSIKEEDETKKKKNGAEKGGFRKHAVVQATSEGKAYAIINESIFGALRIFLRTV